MARKLRLRMVQSPAALALEAARAALTDAGRWPRRLGESPLRLLAAQLDAVDDEFQRLDALTDRICQFIVVHEVPGGFEVAVDLVEVFEFEECEELATALQELLLALRDARSFDVTVYVGVALESPTRALKELRRAARDHRVKLPVPRVEAAQEDAPEPKRTKAAEAPEPEPQEWGGLEDDEDAAAGPLSDAEAYFLTNATLTWPCGADELKAQFIRLARITHPDKNRGDPSAEAAFKYLNQGYDGLRKRLDA